jgi:glyoxylase-like metal-dependent hydrolase (beta-lactamase superfamily II)
MTPVAEDVWQLAVMPRNSINCYVVENYLIDAGVKGSSAKILNSIQHSNITTHVLTHAHADHQGSSKAICDTLNIPLWCSDLEKAQAETGNATMEYTSQKHILTRFQKTFWAGDGYKVARTIKENDYLGDFCVIETPGHSSGHLSFFREKDGILIVGDVATNMNLITTAEGLHLPPDLFTKDKEENIKSLKKLAALAPKVLCFGHGPVFKNNNRQFEQFAGKL